MVLGSKLLAVSSVLVLGTIPGVYEFRKLPHPTTTENENASFIEPTEPAPAAAALGSYLENPRSGGVAVSKLLYFAAQGDSLPQPTSENLLARMTTPELRRQLLEVAGTFEFPGFGDGVLLTRSDLDAVPVPQGFATAEASPDSFPAAYAGAPGGGGPASAATGGAGPTASAAHSATGAGPAANVTPAQQSGSAPALAAAETASVGAGAGAISGGGDSAAALKIDHTNITRRVKTGAEKSATNGSNSSSDDSASAGASSGNASAPAPRSAAGGATLADYADSSSPDATAAAAAVFDATADVSPADPVANPEPSTIILMLAGMAGLGAMKFRCARS